MVFDVKKTNMVKCVAIILMLMHHLFGCFENTCASFGVYSLVIPYPYIVVFSKAAKVCVATYVFLSAYGITISYNKNSVELTEKKKFEKFCFGRYIKLALNFFFVYVIAILTSPLRTKSLMEIYGKNEDGKEVLYAIFDMLGLSNHFGTPSLNETWWYMSLAIVMVFIIPILIIGYKRIGRTMVMVAILITCLGVTRSSVMSGYLFPIVMGIVFAEEGCFERIFEMSIVKNSKVNSFLRLIVCSVLFILLLKIRKEYIDYRYWLDVCAPILLGIIMMDVSNVLPILERPLNFIGEHSMNIFLIHTLIFEYYFRDFIYGFQYWGFVLLALLVTSLLGSIVIEWLKKVLRYNALIKRITQ